MAEKVFKYKVVTQVDTSPLKSLEKSLQSLTKTYDVLGKAFDKSFSSMTKGVKGVTENIAKLGASLKGLSSGKTSVDGLTGSIYKLAAGFGAVAIAQKAIGGIFDFGKKIVEAAKFKQTAVSSLDVFYEGRGSNIFKNLIDVANKTPADTQPLLEFAQQLSGSGFSEKQLNKLTTLRADVESAGGSKSVLDSMSSVLMAAAGGGAPELGSDFIQKFLGKDRFIRYQAKAAGVKDWETGNLENLNKQVKKARDSGKLTGAATVQGIEEAALSRMRSSKIGDMSRKIAEGSIAGAMSNFSNVLDNMLFSSDLEKSPGIKSFIKVINTITDLLLSPEFQGGLAEIIESLFSGFKDLANNPQRIKSILTGLKDAAVAIADAFGAAFKYFSKLVTAGSAKEALLTVVKDLGKVLETVGVYIGQGIKAAFFGGSSEEVKKAVAAGNIKIDRGQSDAISKGVLGVNATVGEYDSLIKFVRQNGGKTEINQIFNGPADPEKVKQATTDAVNKANQQKTQRMAGASR